MQTKSFGIVALFLLATAVLALFSVGCSKDDQSNSKIKADEISVEEKNTIIEQLGQAFGMALVESPEFRDLVWIEATKQVTYDYDVPFEFIKDRDIGGVSVSNLVESKFRLIAPKADFKWCVSSLHNLQLTVPLHQVSSWDATRAPSIAVFPIGISQRDIIEFVGFDPMGQPTTFCSKEEPTEQVIVIRESDRIDRQGRLMVDRHGMVQEEAGRICIRKAREQKEFMLKSGQLFDEEPLIQIISEDSLAYFFAKHEHEQMELKAERVLLMDLFEKAYTNRLKSTQNQVRNKLTSFTNQPRAIKLSWEHAGGSHVTYKVYATGLFKNGVFPIYREKQLVATTTSLNATITLPYSYRMYNLWVEGERSGSNISTSNYVSIHTSERKQGVSEYPSKVSMTASAMRELEGWAANKLEIKFVISLADAKGKPMREMTGGIEYHPHYSWLRMQNTERNYTPSSFLLMDWNKYTINDGTSTNADNGAYTIFWYEKDGDKKDKAYQILTKMVVGVAASQGVNPDLSEGIMSIGSFVFDMDKKDEEIGDSYITWWTRNGTRSFPMPGVVIEHSFENP
jgi:hypothetical protein